MKLVCRFQTSWMCDTVMTSDARANTPVSCSVEYTNEPCLRKLPLPEQATQRCAMKIQITLPATPRVTAVILIAANDWTRLETCDDMNQT
eukprot:3363831-Amphidinium_carterae.1